MNNILNYNIKQNKIDKQKYGIKLNIRNNNKFNNKFTFSNSLLLIIPYIFFTLIFLIIPLIIILIFTFTPIAGDINDNWGILTGTIWDKIGKSMYISIVSTIFIILIGFPFSYIISLSKNKIIKSLLMLVITAPIWINTLVKLIGLKTIFDIINQSQNSTYGDIYTILGLTYLYLPFFIIPIYTALYSLPKNLIHASKDLGRNGFYTFFLIVIPWCKTALLSGIVLVLLPCFISVAVPSFLNNNNNSAMIGDIIINQGENGLNSNIALARTSVLVLVVSSIMLAMYILIIIIPKIYKYLTHNKLFKRGK